MGRHASCLESISGLRRELEQLLGKRRRLYQGTMQTQEAGTQTVGSCVKFRPLK